MKWFISEESGQAVVEYVVLLSLLSIVLIVTLTSVGNQLSTKYDTIQNKVKYAGQPTF